MLKNEPAFKINKLNRRNLALRFMFLFLCLSIFYALHLSIWNPFFLQGQIIGIYWLIPFLPFFSLILFIILDLYVIIVATTLAKSLIKRLVIILTILCCCVFVYVGFFFLYSSHTHMDSVSIKGKVYHLDFNYIYLWGEGDTYSLEIFECDITGLFCKLSSKPQPIYQTNTLALERRYYLADDLKNRSIIIRYDQNDIYTCYVDGRKPAC